MIGLSTAGGEGGAWACCLHTHTRAGWEDFLIWLLGADGDGDGDLGVGKTRFVSFALGLGGRMRGHGIQDVDGLREFPVVFLLFGCMEDG